jgi:TATA-box binding protein (TBP) (component of TFIID and TFIIIB)
MTTRRSATGAKNHHNNSNNGEDEKPAEFCPVAISNIVCTSAMGEPIDTRLTFLLFNRQLAPPGRELKSHLMQCMVGGQSIVTQDLYKSGKNVLTGARDENAALLGIYKSRYQLIKKTGRWIGYRDYTRQNYVAFAGFGFKLDLAKLEHDFKACLQPPEAVRNFKPVAEKRREWFGKAAPTGNQRKRANQGQMMTMRNEEKFKGIQIYWNYPLVQVCFSSGMSVITGTDDEADILSVFRCVEDWEKYRLQPSSPSTRTTTTTTRRDIQSLFFHQLARLRREHYQNQQKPKQLLLENGGVQSVIKKHTPAQGKVTNVIRNPHQSFYRKTTKMKTKMLETLLTLK